MSRQEKFFPDLWPPLITHSALCTCIMHHPNFPHQQEYLLNHEEQHSPSIKLLLVCLAAKLC